MRRLLLLFSLFGASEATAPPPGPASETAWLCHSRIGGWVPRLGRLRHSSVAICPCGELPVVAGPRGARNNPRCAFVGTQPRRTTFLPEERRVGVVFQPALVPPDVVMQRVTRHERLWRWFYNCHHAAAEATGHPPPGRSILPRP
jgi:hypothetical protein